MNLKELFEVYDSQTARLEGLNAEIAKVEKERSDTVKAIYGEIAPKKKLDRDGRQLTIVIRGETHFFRGASTKDDVVKV